MTASYRLLPCLAAAALTVTLTPTAFADDAPAPRAAGFCGVKAENWNGTYVDPYDRAATYEIDLDANSFVVFYRGEEVDRGKVYLNPRGELTWKVDGQTFLSENVTCNDLSSPRRVTDFEGFCPGNQDNVMFRRARTRA